MLQIIKCKHMHNTGIIFHLSAVLHAVFVNRPKILCNLQVSMFLLIHISRYNIVLNISVAKTLPSNRGFVHSKNLLLQV